MERAWEAALFRYLLEGGFDALVPSPRQPAPRTLEEVLALAEALSLYPLARPAGILRRSYLEDCWRLDPGVTEEAKHASVREGWGV